MSKKNTKRALLSSVLCLVLCLAMLTSTTFAWFTDSVTSGKNQIVAGNLDVELYHTNKHVTTAEKVDGRTDLFTVEDNKTVLWEPGMVVWENFTVANEGNLALKYQLAVNFDNEVRVNDKGLSDVLKVAVVDPIATNATREEVLAAAKATGVALKSFAMPGELLAGNAKTFGVVIFWEPSDKDNDYNMNNGNKGNVLSIDLGINLFATQLMHEDDSFNNTYDKDTAVFTVAEANAMLKENKPVALVNCIEPDGVLEVPAAYDKTLILDNVTIASVQVGSATTFAASEVTTDATKIVILGKVVIEATEDGMSAIGGKNLYISGNGRLTAVGKGKGAFGIGGMTATDITVENITIDYIAGGHAYGVGTDTKYYKDAPEGGAAIGSATNGANITLDNVHIVKAVGGSKAAGIGARYHVGVNINIANSTIDHVEGGVSAAGIGGSRISKDRTENGTTINITNSVITAKGGAYGAGIGSGYDTHCNDGQPLCTINIADSTINAAGGQYATGVGTGYHHAALAGEIKSSTVNAVSGKKFYKDTYTAAMDLGFGVVDPTREGKQTDSKLIFNGVEIRIPAPGKPVSTAEEFKEALTSGGTFILADSIQVDEKIEIPAGKTVVLSLNGNEITAGYQSGSTTKHLYPIDNYGNLTIEDGTISGRGIYNRDGAVLTINGATVKALDTNGGACVWSYGSGEVYLNDANMIGYTGCVSSEGYLEINGGTYTCYSGISDNGEFLSSPTYNIRAYNGLKITDGTFTSRHGVIYVGGGECVIEDGSYTIEFAAATTSNVVYVFGNTELTINGGSFISDDSNDKADSGAAVLVDGSGAKVVIYDGTFVGMNGMLSGNVVAYGGTFNTVFDYNHYDNIEKAVADGYEAIQNADGSWTVSRKYTRVNNSEELIAAIQAGEEAIYLNAGDYALRFTNNVSFNVDGMTIVGADGANLSISSSEVWYGRVQGDNVTFENITFTTNVGATGQATYNGCTFTGDWVICASSNNDKTYFNNCTINGCLNTSVDFSAGDTFVKGSTVNKAEYSGSATMNFENCTIGELISWDMATVLTGCTVTTLEPHMTNNTIVQDGVIVAP